jgi:putative transposase
VDGRTRQTSAGHGETDALYEQIGRLKGELDWLKKMSACSTDELRVLVERDHAEISVRRQCELPSISRAGLYYRPAGEARRICC